MKVLITGGCGFLGTNLSVRAIKNQWDLILFDNLSRLGSEQNLKWLKTQGEFEYVRGDIQNINSIENLVKAAKPDVIFHLAGQVAMTTSIENPRLDFEVNALGTFNLLDAVRKYSPDSTVVYSSTNKTYGDLDWVKYGETESRFVAVDYPNGFPETIPLDFRSPYGCSKGAADQYMLDFHRVYGLKTIVFRHSSMYGGRQFPTFDQGWIGWFIQKALEARAGKLSAPFTISGTGKQVRDVLHAEDMTALYFAAIDNVEGAKGQAFNIGGGMANSLSLLELFEILEKEVNAKLSYSKLPVRKSDQKVFVADIHKAEQIFKWKPIVSKIDGVRKMVDWLQNDSGFYKR